MAAVSLGAGGQGVSSGNTGRARPAYSRTCARHQAWLRAWHTEMPNIGCCSPSLPGPIQGLGTHDAELCYKYMCLVSEGGQRAETVLYTAGIGLEADHRERQTVRPSSGACNTWLAGVLAGVLSRAPRPEVLGSVGSGTRAQLTSFRAWWDMRPHQENAGSHGGQGRLPRKPWAPHQACHARAHLAGKLRQDEGRPVHI